MPLLDVHVKPRARKPGLGGREADGRLALSVHAVPEDGAANREVCALVAAALGVPARAVTVFRGATSRRKTLKIEGATDAAIAALGCAAAPREGSRTE